MGFNQFFSPVAVDLVRWCLEVKPQSRQKSARIFRVAQEMERRFRVKKAIPIINLSTYYGSKPVSMTMLVMETFLERKADRHAT